MIYEAIQAMFPADVRVYILDSEHEGTPALSDYPHVVLGGTLPTEHSGPSPDEPTLADELDAMTATVRFTYAATSYGSLKWLVPRVRAAINHQSPVIPGYHVERLKLRSLMEMQPDRDISIEGRNPVFAKDEATLRASKL